MVWLVGIGYLLFGVAAFVWPSTLQRLAAKEGPVEHVSHLVLAVGAFAWIVGGVRASRGKGSVSIAMGIFSIFVLGEELAWGEVIGIDVVADRLRAWVGRPDVHNAWSGASYLLFALPPAALFGPAILGLLGASLDCGPLRAWRAAVDPVMPTFDQTLAAVTIALVSILATLAVPSWEDALDELTELWVYVLLLAVAWPRARTST